MLVNVARVEKSASLKGTPVRSKVSILQSLCELLVSGNFTIAQIIADMALSYLHAYALLTAPNAIVLKPLSLKRFRCFDPHAVRPSNANGNTSRNTNSLVGHTFRIASNTFGLLSRCMAHESNSGTKMAGKECSSPIKKLNCVSVTPSRNAL